MRKPGESDESDRDEPPGGRAFERLRQFEQERGFDVSEDVEPPLEPDPAPSADEDPDQPAT